MSKSNNLFYHDDLEQVKKAIVEFKNKFEETQDSFSFTAANLKERHNYIFEFIGLSAGSLIGIARGGIIAAEIAVGTFTWPVLLGSIALVAIGSIILKSNENAIIADKESKSNKLRE